MEPKIPDELWTLTENGCFVDSCYDKFGGDVLVAYTSKTAAESDTTNPKIKPVLIGVNPALLRAANDEIAALKEDLKRAHDQHDATICELFTAGQTEVRLEAEIARLKAQISDLETEVETAKHDAIHGHHGDCDGG